MASLERVSELMRCKKKKKEKRRGKERKSRCQNRPRGGGQTAGFPKRRHLVGARPRMFPLQPMTKAHERGVEHMPLQLEQQSGREQGRGKERGRKHIQTHTHRYTQRQSKREGRENVQS